VACEFNNVYLADMKGLAPGIIILCALVAALFSLFGDDSYGRMQSLQKSYDAQLHKNDDLRAHVSDLKRDVYGLQHDDRALEKAARNELGMARPDEMIFIFDKPAKGSGDGK
jgi:cell division protein FtsB